MKRTLVCALLAVATAGLAGAAGPIYLPHLVSGGGMTSTVNLTNLFTNQTQRVSLRFYQENGLPWTVTTNLGTAAAFDLDLAFGASQSIRLTSESPTIASGWAAVHSRDNALVSAFYDYSGGGSSVVGSAGVIPCTADVLSLLPVEMELTQNRNTGLAVVNPSAETVQVQVELLDTGGASLGTKTLNLAAGAKFVGYLNATTLFPLFDGIHGYLKVTGTVPLAVMGMRTVGPVFSSLPAVHDFLPWRNARTSFVSPTLGSDETGDGTLLSPYRTIYKATMRSDRAWTLFLLPGLYDANAGEHFPVVLAYCMSVRGSGTGLTYIRGGGPYAQLGSTAVVCGFRGMLSDATVLNPNGDGITVEDDATFVNCRVTRCGGRGFRLLGGATLMMNNVITGNGIGIQVDASALPDMGGGTMMSSGGNFLFGNTQCDLFVNRNGMPYLRFNSWDNPVPTLGSTCTGGVDIATPYPPYAVNY